MSQKQMIIDFINAHGSITQLEAIENFGCTRLPARICELIKDGYAITKHTKKSKNRFGKPITFMVYGLMERGDIIAEQNIEREHMLV